jgi:cholesterol oxidase
LNTDASSHLEPVRYPAGSGYFRLFGAPHVTGRNALLRLLAIAKVVLRHPLKILRAYLVPDWARFSMILLYMRSLEGHLSLKLGRHPLTLGRRGLVTRVSGERPRAQIPEASALADRIAGKINGVPMSLVNETLLDVPTTAHILGGCCMGSDAARGVIDHRHRVFGYEGLYVIDGAAVSANPGVNPSLTIAALAERAMTFIPVKPR